ncbi:MAG: DUF2948 family protein [Pseudomonadota bacterium]
MTDARFEDAVFSDRPLKLKAEDADDLAVISSLVQDAVCKSEDIHWMARHRRLVVILRRFRWEDRAEAEAQRRPYERVQSALSIHDATAIRVRGIDQQAPDAIQNLLALHFDPAEDGAGVLRLVFADGAEVALDVECCEATLSDLSQPWEAKAKAAPSHPE